MFMIELYTQAFPHLSLPYRKASNVPNATFRDQKARESEKTSEAVTRDFFKF
jgi:hypothetical protein